MCVCHICIVRLCAECIHGGVVSKIPEFRISQPVESCPSALIVKVKKFTFHNAAFLHLPTHTFSSTITIIAFKKKYQGGVTLDMHQCISST